MKYESYEYSGWTIEKLPIQNVGAMKFYEIRITTPDGELLSNFFSSEALAIEYIDKRESKRNK